MSTNYYSVPKMSSIPSDVEVSTIPSSSHRHHHKSRHGNKSFTELTQNESIRQVGRNKNHRLKESSSFSKGYGVPYSSYNYSDVGIIESDVIYPAGSSRHNRHERRNKGKESNKIQPVSETMINEKPTSVTGEQIGKARSPLFRVDAENTNERQGGSHRGHKSRKNRSRSNGYGRIGENLFFIEQGSNQKAPTGYVYKGKIEVQTMECESGSITVPAPRPVAPQPCPPVVNPCSGPCPPGWHQVVISGTGAGAGAGAGAGISSGGFGGGNYSFSSGSAGGFGGFSGSSNGQLIADYVVESTADGGFGGSSSYSEHFGGSSSAGGFGKTRVKVIELWEKKSKDSHRKSSSSSSSDRSHSKNTTTTITQKVDISQLRDELLKAMERMFQSNNKYGAGSSGGESEVRVIVQPIQPVFYMPRQTETTHPVQPNPPIPQPTPGPGPVPRPTPTPAPVQPVRAPSPKVIYVPRNVYVPVVKPVFVPRERVIVRPQVIHVPRPVVVDRPVPVTQRPIIIDREKPIPVPVRVGGDIAPSQPNIIREEYVYQDNTPYAYGGRPAECAAGINYGYMPSQVEHQYTVSPPEQVVTTVYENQGQAVGGQNLIEVLDQTVNSTWQPVQSSTLLNQYGSSAMNLVQGGGGYETSTYQNNQQYQTTTTYSKGDESSCEELLRLISGGRVASGGSSY